MCKDGWTYFQLHYPKICETFASTFDAFLSIEETARFFDDLLPFYDSTQRYNRNVTRKIQKIIFSELWKQNHLVRFLLCYAPRYPFSADCVNILEESLNNVRISFEDRGKTLRILKGNMNDFWGRYCELEIANNLSKLGCLVHLLERDRTRCRYPDIRACYRDFNFNIEVTNRDCTINRLNVINALRNKIIDEAEQLPPNGEINVIIVFISDALIFSNSIAIKKMINLFDFSDVIYENSDEVESIVPNGREIQRPRRKSILETRSELKHIAAIAGRYFNQVPLRSMDRQTITMSLYRRDDFPTELTQLLLHI